jgi:hypothetical protein
VTRAAKREVAVRYLFAYSCHTWSPGIEMWGTKRLAEKAQRECRAEGNDVGEIVKVVVPLPKRKAGKK